MEEKVDHTMVKVDKKVDRKVDTVNTKVDMKVDGVDEKVDKVKRDFASSWRPSAVKLMWIWRHKKGGWIRWITICRKWTRKWIRRWIRWITRWRRWTRG